MRSLRSFGIHRPGRVLGVALAGAIVLSACGSGSGSADQTAAAADGSVDLAAAGCPEKIVIQTDWNPEAEHGHLYELFGDDAVIDSGQKSVTGTLYDGDSSTGVLVEVRAGGPAIGYTGVATQMYTDTDITMGYVTTDDQIANSGSAPTTAFFAPLELSPQMVMWDPETYPQVNGIPDLRAALEGTGGVWRYFAGQAYMDYFLSTDMIAENQVDSSYDGTAANFVAAGGKDVQQGYASAEPYVYENEVQNWMKPVKYALLSDAGWNPYQSAMTVRRDDLEGLSGCLAALTPVLQRAEVSYFGDPTKANALILDLVEQYNTGWTYSQGVADYAVQVMLDRGLASNGTNSYIGDFDDARMTEFFDKANAVLTEMGSPVEENLTASDLYTNDFIDQSIGLG